MSMGQATGPIYTCETTGHAPDAVLDAHPEHYRMPRLLRAALAQSSPRRRVTHT